LASKLRVPTIHNQGKHAVRVCDGPAGKCCRSGGLGLASAQTPGKIRKVELLSYKGELKWKQDEASLKVEMPGEKISDVGITLKVELA
jgi:hypothetical protein